MWNVELHVHVHVQQQGRRAGVGLDPGCLLNFPENRGEQSPLVLWLASFSIKIHSMAAAGASSRQVQSTLVAAKSKFNRHEEAGSQCTTRIMITGQSSVGLS